MISPRDELPHHTRTKFTTTTGQSVELSRPDLEVSASPIFLMAMYKKSCLHYQGDKSCDYRITHCILLFSTLAEYL